MKEITNENHLKGAAYSNSKEFYRSTYIPLLKQVIEICKDIKDKNNSIISAFYEHVPDTKGFAADTVIIEEEIERLKQDNIDFNREIDQVKLKRNKYGSEYGSVTIQWKKTLISINEHKINELQNVVDNMRAFNSECANIYDEIEQLLERLSSAVDEMDSKSIWSSTDKEYVIPLSLRNKISKLNYFGGIKFNDNAIVYDGEVWYLDSYKKFKGSVMYAGPRTLNSINSRMFKMDWSKGFYSMSIEGPDGRGSKISSGTSGGMVAASGILSGISAIYSFFSGGASYEVVNLEFYELNGEKRARISIGNSNFDQQFRSVKIPKGKKVAMINLGSRKAPDPNSLEAIYFQKAVEKDYYEQRKEKFKWDEGGTYYYYMDKQHKEDPYYADVVRFEGNDAIVRFRMYPEDKLTLQRIRGLTVKDEVDITDRLEAEVRIPNGKIDIMNAINKE